jgi:hypothetical protein
MKEITIRLHEIATDGLPDMERLTGRVAFVFDGCVVSGWPLTPSDLWEADTDVGRSNEFGGVTYWIEFPVPVCELPRGDA